MYIPDSWVILRIVIGPDEVYYKVLAGWSGSYLNGSSWKLNSGISSMELKDDYWYFHGFSGSVYKCHVEGERMRMSMAEIYNQLLTLYSEKVELVGVKDIHLDEIA